MPGQQQIQKQTTEKSTETVSDLPSKSEKGEALKSELDDLLDEIDEVLETNAEEFVKAYIQKGGE